MRKLLVLLVLMTAGAAIAAPDVFADQPTFTPSPNTDYVDMTCGFPVSVHYVVNGETAKTFTSGTTIVTGPSFAELTGPTGKSVTLNNSGPAKIFTAPDGSVLIIGHGLAFGPLVTPNGLVLSWVAGVVSISTSPLEGVLLHGTVLLDLCTALAP